MKAYDNTLNSSRSRRLHFFFFFFPNPLIHFPWQSFFQKEWSLGSLSSSSSCVIGFNYYSTKFPFCPLSEICYALEAILLRSQIKLCTLCSIISCGLKENWHGRISHAHNWCMENAAVAIRFHWIWDAKFFKF